jgi:hypothetical protein
MHSVTNSGSRYVASTVPTSLSSPRNATGQYAIRNSKSNDTRSSSGFRLPLIQRTGALRFLPKLANTRIGANGRLYRGMAEAQFYGYRVGSPRRISAAMQTHFQFSIVWQSSFISNTSNGKTRYKNLECFLPWPSHIDCCQATSSAANSRTRWYTSFRS